MSTVPLNFSWRVWIDEEGRPRTLRVEGVQEDLPVATQRLDDGTIYQWSCDLVQVRDPDLGSLRIPLLDANDWTLMLPDCPMPSFYLTAICIQDVGVRVLVTFDKAIMRGSSPLSTIKAVPCQVRHIAESGWNLWIPTPMSPREILQHLVFDDPSLIDVVIP